MKKHTEEFKREAVRIALSSGSILADPLAQRRKANPQI